MKTRYYLIKRSGQNVKSNGPLLECIGTFDGTADDASAKLMGYAVDDHEAPYDDDDEYLPGIMDKGDLSYEHDSRTYSYEAQDDLSEEEMRAILRDRTIY